MLQEDREIWAAGTGEKAKGEKKGAKSMVIGLAGGCGLRPGRHGAEQGQLYSHGAGRGLRSHGHLRAGHAAEQIIREFAAKESEFQKALNHYTYRRVARVQTIDDDNKVDGEYYQVDDVIFDSTGKRTEKTVYAPESTCSG